MAKEKLFGDVLAPSISILGAVVTLAINPWTAYDPINVVKMGALSAMILPIVFSQITYNRRLLLSDKTTLMILLAIIAALLVSLVVNDRNRFQQIWGVWGRNTGILTYVCFLALLYSSIVVGKHFSFDVVIRLFHKLSYLIIAYLFIQILEIDPINWSQKQAIATLGNINFVSAFLGIVIISSFFEILKKCNTPSAKIHFSSIAFVSFFLIYRSGSIQGLLMAAAGIMLILAFRFRNSLGNTLKFMIVLAILLAISVIGGGAFGNGPLGATLRQESLIYRLDYWKAGVAMTASSPLFGRGMDSYGDYYREYRDSIAATRTGPQRTSNTAHNIFLDVSTGAGVLAGLLFICIFVLAAIRVKKIFKLVENSHEIVRLSAISFAFFLYWLISINQIGFTVWGFIFLGILLGNSLTFMEGITSTKDGDKSSRNKTQSKPTDLGHSLNFTKSSLVFIMSFIIGASTSFLPILQDIKALDAARSKDSSKLINVLSEEYTPTELRNKILLELSQSLSAEKFLELVVEEIQRDERNTFAWNAIVATEGSDPTLKRKALLELKRLDPENQELASLEKSFSD